jgi:hypothetical protein
LTFNLFEPFFHRVTMDEKRKEILRQAMIEASLLPPDDPRRCELEAEISRAGEWAESQWLQIQAENERLRLDLRRVTPPESLEKELLELPRKSAGELNRLIREHWLARAAAILLIAVVSGGIMYYLNNRGGQGSLVELARLAIDNHVHNQDVTVITLNPEYLERHLAAAVPFKIVMPAVNSQYNLVGGRSCSLGTHPVVYTRWASREGCCSLFQFRCSDFDLPDQSGKEVIHSSKVDCPEAKGRDCNAVVWSEQGRGYALVADSSCAMKCISSGSK